MFSVCNVTGRMLHVCCIYMLHAKICVQAVSSKPFGKVNAANKVT